MGNNLVEPADLVEFSNGTTYSEAVVDAAVMAVRNYLGWHVAPRESHTVILDGPRTQLLALPTLDPGAEVAEVRDATRDDQPVLTGWRKTGKPLLYRQDGWPCGPGALEVDLIDGFADCPADLLPFIAAACAEMGTTTGGVLKSVRLDDFAETYDTERAATGPTRTASYRIPRKTSA